MLEVRAICSSKERAASAESVQSQVKIGYQVAISATWVQLNRGKSRNKLRKNVAKHWGLFVNEIDKASVRC